MYEGLSSNFGVIQNGVLVTAPQATVLPGVTLQIILQTCEKIKLPVEFRAPNINDIDKFEGAFISSTSRMLMPINTIRIMSNNQVKREIQLPKCSVFSELGNQLTEQMQKSATPIPQ